MSGESLDPINYQKPINYSPLTSDEIATSFNGNGELAKNLKKYGIEISSYDFCELSGIEWSETLKENLEALKGIGCVPGYVFQVKTLNETDQEEVERRIELAKKLKKYGIEMTSFNDFEELSGIEWSETLEQKLKASVGIDCVPEDVFRVKILNEMDQEEIERRIELVKNLEKYEIEMFSFYDFCKLSGIEWSETFEQKLKTLKGIGCVPGTGYIFQVKILNEMDQEEIERRIELVKNLTKYGIEMTSFNDFEELSGIEWSETLEQKLKALEGKKNEPKYFYKIIGLIKEK